MEKTFINQRYLVRLSESGKNWLDVENDRVLSELSDFLRTLMIDS